MEFTDLHIHALCGVDDGARAETDMHAMVDASYADGVRMLCVTPHYHPGYFGENHEKAAVAFAALKRYAAGRYPDLELYLGNELRYSAGCVSWLSGGQCRTLNGTQYVLVDFFENAEAKTILSGLDALLNAGYSPVLAHVERYRSLWGQMRTIRSLPENGILLQMDTQSVLGGFGFRVQRQCKNLLHEGMVELICSDSHDVRKRPPELSECFWVIEKKYGQTYAQALFCGNGKRLLHAGSSQEGSD